MRAGSRQATWVAIGAEMSDRERDRVLWMDGKAKETEGYDMSGLVVFPQEGARVIRLLWLYNVRWSYFVGQSEGDLKVDSDGLQSPRGPA